VIERPRLAARDPGGADRLDRRVGADGVGQATQRREVLGDRGQGAPDAFERVAVDRTAAGVRPRRSLAGRGRRRTVCTTPSAARGQIDVAQQTPARTPFVIKLLH
jgi:hypothetical protein